MTITSKKVLALLAAVALMLSVFVFSALADETGTNSVTSTDGTAITTNATSIPTGTDATTPAEGEVTSTDGTAITTNATSIPTGTDATTPAEGEVTTSTNEASTETTSAETTTATTAEGSGTTDDKDKPAESTSWISDHKNFVIAMAVIVFLVILYFVLRLVSAKFRDKTTKFWKEYRSEFKKLVWPTKQQLWKNTAVVLVTMVAFVIVLGLLDLALSEGIYWLGDLVDLILPVK